MRRAGDDSRRFAAKYVQPTAHITLETFAAARGGRDLLKRFLDRAAIQQSVAKVGKHWALLHEVGSSDGGAFYVTDHFPRTVKKLISGPAPLNARALHRIMFGTVEGLVELKQACDRGHGNLKPSNVLVSGEVNRGRLRVVLTDPLESSPAGPVTTAGDLNALGEMLFQLVTRRQFHPLSWPVDESEEWSRLGGNADRWRSLCTDLLNPDSSSRPNLYEVRAAIRSFKSSQLGIASLMELPFDAQQFISQMFETNRRRTQTTDREKQSTSHPQPIVTTASEPRAQPAYNPDDVSNLQTILTSSHSVEPTAIFEPAEPLEPIEFPPSLNAAAPRKDMNSMSNENHVVTLPRDILDRVERVLEFHQSTKHTYESVRALTPRSHLADQLAVVRTFPGLPKVALPTGLLDLSVASLALMREGVTALPDSHVQPPQDLKTLATWLYMAYGVSAEKKFGIYKYRLRTCPSASALFPCEIYVAALSIAGIGPGLYSFNPHEFSLTKLREGADTLAHIKRGRPDLAFLKSVPAALLVSTNFARSAYKYRARGYRIALADAGHLITNIVATANGLGISTMARLQMNDSTMRELIGIPLDADFGSFEAIQAMVVWADDSDAHKEGEGASPTQPPPPRRLPPLERPPLAPRVGPQDSILAAHFDCMKPGIPIREIRPPLTELSPLPPDHRMHEMVITEEPPRGPSMREVLLKRRSSRDFTSQNIPRNKFLAINQAAFRTGTFVPLYPDGPHVALIRPIWLVHDISGLTPGVWYYHPPADQWTMLIGGDFRKQSAFICLEQARCGNAAAVCLMAANLHTLMHGAGPDLYRLAHLEAGIIGQRLTLAAGGGGIGTCGIGSFYDDEIRKFLGLEHTGWEIMYATALGFTAPEAEPPGHPSLGIG
ncbi:MAG TPA: SagB family peptide dehydrogenase [Tepidisphaeraceae bacterium]